MMALSVKPGPFDDGLFDGAIFDVEFFVGQNPEPSLGGWIFVPPPPPANWVEVPRQAGNWSLVPRGTGKVTVQMQEPS